MNTTPLNAAALEELCCLLEQTDSQMPPDGIWLSGKHEIYDHLRDLGVLKLALQVETVISCPGCLYELVHPEQWEAGSDHYDAYCPDCGHKTLAQDQVRPWQAHPVQMARWLNSALGLKTRHPVTSLIEDVLWHLGEREFRRRQYSFFFGRRLAQATDQVLAAVARRAAPGAGMVITTTDPAKLPKPSPCIWVPLLAVAHLRKSAVELENLEAYFEEPAPGDTNETSLRLLHSHQVVLIEGERIHVPLQVHDFLSVLEAANGEEVDKETMADALHVSPDFRLADLFKRHRIVQQTFVRIVRKGCYRLRGTHDE